MQLTVNGEKRTLETAPTVRELIEQLGLKGRAVAVEINRKIVPKRQHESTRLSEGDVVEVVTLVGGG